MNKLILNKRIKVITIHTISYQKDLLTKIGFIPDDYLNLMNNFGDLELCIDNSFYLRLVSYRGVLDYYEGYNFNKYLPNSIPIGDNGGGLAIIYYRLNDIYNLYLCDLGDISESSLIYLSPNLNSFLYDGIGLDNFIL